MAALVPLAVAPIGWWVVGDLTEEAVRGRADLMYLFSPPRWSTTVDRIVLVASAAGALALSVVLYLMVRRVGRWRAALLVAATWVLGLAWGALARTLTVGASGANMGGLALPLVLMLLVAQGAMARTAAIWKVSGRRSTRDPDRVAP